MEIIPNFLVGSYRSKVCRFRELRKRSLLSSNVCIINYSHLRIILSRAIREIGLALYFIAATASPTDLHELTTLKMKSFV